MFIEVKEADNTITLLVAPSALLADKMVNFFNDQLGLKVKKLLFSNGIEKALKKVDSNNLKRAKNYHMEFNEFSQAANMISETKENVKTVCPCCGWSFVD